MRIETAHQPFSRLLVGFGGGTRPSRPRSRSSSVMRSNWMSAALVGARHPAGADRQRRHRLGLGLVDLDMLLQRLDQIFLQILGREGRDRRSRAATTTGFLSLSRSTRDRGFRPRSCAPDGSASSTSSKRFSTLSTQSSTVTRAIERSLLGSSRFADAVNFRDCAGLSLNAHALASPSCLAWQPRRTARYQ